MKKLLFILIIGGLVFGCNSDNKESDKEERYHINDVIAHDNLTYYKEDMSLLNGVVFDEFGEQGLFKDGKKEGLHKGWYNTGNLEREIYYKNGLENGIVKSWYENGQLNSEFVCLDGKIIGKSKNYNENGVLKSELHYKNGELVKMTVYRDDGSIEVETNYKNDIIHGSQFFYTLTGDIFSEFNYKDGKKDGFQKQFTFKVGIIGEVYKEGVFLYDKCFDYNGDEINCDVLWKRHSLSINE